ncbi:MAG: hypothetical protein H7145_08455 [Akkermansiaceae bacterium]|nr:hypothetical protein [Armatimonadota bacterium]
MSTPQGSTTPSVSSPVATGGGGTFFEQHVGADFLALLLTGAIPPVLLDCRLEEVRFQTEVGGWKTDDLMVIGSRGTDVSTRRHLAMQVKRSFTVSASDAECKNAILDFWADFSEPGKFDATNDALALVILRGTNTLLGSLGTLLDCARAVESGADFALRLSQKGFLSQKTVEQAGVIRDIISTTRTVSDDEFWRFLNVLHLISLDLNTSTAQTKAECFRYWLIRLRNPTRPALQVRRGANSSNLLVKSCRPPPSVGGRACRNRCDSSTRLHRL